MREARRSTRLFFAACALSVVAVARNADASGFEVAAYSGPAFTTYKQTLGLKGSSPTLQFARLSVKEGPSLEASGGTSLGLGATLYLSNSFGIEGRIDAVDIDLQSFGGNYTLDLTSGSAVISTPVTLATAETMLQQVRPLSLNLRLQSQGRIGLGISAGVSWLRSLESAGPTTLSVSQQTGALPLALIAAPAASDGAGHVGFNGGVTLRVGIARGLAVMAEGRGFAFKRAQLQWALKESTGSLATVERALLNALPASLDLPLFTPGFWSARVGVSYRF